MSRKYLNKGNEQPYLASDFRKKHEQNNKIKLDEVEQIIKQINARLDKCTDVDIKKSILVEVMINHYININTLEFVVSLFKDAGWKTVSFHYPEFEPNRVVFNLTAGE